MIPYPNQGWASSSAAESLETLKNLSSTSWVIVQMCSKVAWQWCLTTALLLNETERGNFTPAVSSAEAEKCLYDLTATSQGQPPGSWKEILFQLLISKKLKPFQSFVRLLKGTSCKWKVFLSSAPLLKFYINVPWAYSCHSKYLFWSVTSCDI